MLERAARWAELKQWERRELGQQLRRLGLSYREIREIIPVPPATLSSWCRDIELTQEQCERLEQGRRRRFAQRRVATSEHHRSAAREAARAEAAGLMSDPFWVAGVVAYWAEGAKRQNVMQFSNSDPALLALFVIWASKYLQVTQDRFTIRLHLHGGQDEQERKLFWSTVTGIPLSQFGKTYVKPEGTGHRKNRLYNGTASVTVRRSSRLVQLMMGWIDAVAEHYARG